jgi:hypothetical protein
MAQKKQLTDAQIKAQVLARAQQQQPDDLFPTEIVPLPSKGLVYPKDNPLSVGQVEIRYMTAKDEDILTNQNYLKTGRALDLLYKSIIVGNGEGQPIDIDDMISGDKSAIMLAARILGYGPDYTITVTPKSGKPFQHVVNLNKLTVKPIDESLYNHTPEFDYELPISKKVVRFTLTTDKITKAIQREQKQHEKSGIPSRSITTQLKHTVISIDGNDDKEFVHKFITDHLLARDSLALRSYIVDVTPDYDLNIHVDSPENGFDEEIILPIDVQFFWPRS